MFNSGPSSAAPAPADAPDDLRENSRELEVRRNTAAVRNLSAFLGNFATNCGSAEESDDYDDDDFAPASPDDHAGPVSFGSCGLAISSEGCRPSHSKICYLARCRVFKRASRAKNLALGLPITANANDRAEVRSSGAAAATVARRATDKRKAKTLVAAAAKNRHN